MLAVPEIFYKQDACSTGNFLQAGCLQYRKFSTSRMLVVRVNFYKQDACRTTAQEREEQREFYEKN